MAKRFTLAEAEALLPELQRLLRNAIDLKTVIEDAQSTLASMAQRAAMAGGVAVNVHQALEARSRRDASAQQLKQAIEDIQQTGCVVKDLDMGLLDFPCLYRGREVYLCWRLGESGISHWHGVDEGFAGRKPVDEDFLGHHRGDAPN
jgi:hypothetical protein